MSNFIKISPVRARLFHADGLTNRKTDTMKLRNTFCNFVKMPKKMKPHEIMTKGKETDATQGM
jgi:hypothetical protein